MKRIKNFLIIILTFILILNLVSANNLEYNESFGELVFPNDFFIPVSQSFINYTPLENYSQEIFPIGLSGTNSNFSENVFNLKVRGVVYGNSKNRMTFFIPECNYHNCYITPLTRLSFKTSISGQTATSYYNYNNYISLAYVDDFEFATISNYSFKMLWADNEDGISGGFCDLGLRYENGTPSPVNMGNFNYTFDFLSTLHHLNYYSGRTNCSESIHYNQPFNTFILNSDDNSWTTYMNLIINLDELRIEGIYNESPNDLPEVTIFYNNSFKCLSDTQQEICFPVNITYTDKEDDVGYFSQVSDFQPTKILDIDYLKETKSTFINFFIIDLLNKLNSDNNFLNRFDNESCEYATNIIENNFNQKGIKIVQGFTENKTQRLNGIGILNPSKCGEVDGINKTRYLGFILDNPVRKAIINFRFFIPDEPENIGKDLYYFGVDTESSGFFYQFRRNINNEIEIRRLNNLVTTIPLSQYYQGSNVYDSSIFGFEQIIDLETEIESFKIYKKENGFPKEYIYESINYTITIETLNSIDRVDFYTTIFMGDETELTFFVSDVFVSVLKDSPSAYSPIKPEEFCFNELGDFESKLYVTDSAHIYRNFGDLGFITKTLYFSVYDNETNPLCFLPNQLIVSEFEFDNPDSLPPDDTIFNQVLILIRIFAVIAFKLGFLNILRAVIKVVLVYLIWKWYKKLSFEQTNADDILRIISVNMFFLIIFLYLGLYIEKSIFVIVSAFGLLYLGHEINIILGIKETDSNKIALYSTAFFNILSIIFYGFLQVAFKANFGIPQIPNFVITNVNTALKAVGSLIVYIFNLLFFTIPEIPIYINVIFILVKVISIISIVAVVKNLLNPIAQA